MTRIRALVGIVALLAASSGCGGKSDDKSLAKASPEARAAHRADVVWRDSCQTCHGKTGDGKGAGSRNLNPKPRDMRDAAWQARTTDDQLRRVILKGGEAVGMSRSMPPTPALQTDKAALDALVSKIRNFAKTENAP